MAEQSSRKFDEQRDRLYGEFLEVVSYIYTSMLITVGVYFIGAILDVIFRNGVVLSPYFAVAGLLLAIIRIVRPWIFRRTPQEVFIESVKSAVGKGTRRSSDDFIYLDDGWVRTKYAEYTGQVGFLESETKGITASGTAKALVAEGGLSASNSQGFKVLPEYLFCAIEGRLRAQYPEHSQSTKLLDGSIVWVSSVIISFGVSDSRKNMIFRQPDGKNLFAFLDEGSAGYTRAPYKNYFASNSIMEIPVEILCSIRTNDRIVISPLVILKAERSRDRSV